MQPGERPRQADPEQPVDDGRDGGGDRRGRVQDFDRDVGRAGFGPGAAGVVGQAGRVGGKPDRDGAPGLVQRGGGDQRIAAVVAWAGNQQQMAARRARLQPVGGGLPARAISVKGASAR